jgi:hypothetical protein
VFAAQPGKALAPKEVLFVGYIPQTRNAKVMRRIVRAAYLGDTSTLENPASLDEIKHAAGWGAQSSARGVEFGAYPFDFNPAFAQLWRGRQGKLVTRPNKIAAPQQVVWNKPPTGSDCASLL